MLLVWRRRGSALLCWAATSRSCRTISCATLVAELERRFRDEALTTAAQAATIILDGVKADRWRILVGADAHKIDEMVRQSPERAYDIAFFDEFARAAGWTEVNGEVFCSTDAGDSWSKFAREFGEVHALIWVPN